MDENTKKWRRLYMAVEHSRRRQMSNWKHREHKMKRTISDLRETAELLSAEIRRGKSELRSQMRLISWLQETLSANNLPTGPTVMSFKMSLAAPDEMCPLALEPINCCSLPFDGCCEALDPLKPELKCAELECKHRFSATWLMYHFVRNSTFCCPVCRKGLSHFRFEKAVVPPCMQHLV